MFQVSEVYDHVLPGIRGCRVKEEVFPDFSYKIRYEFVMLSGAIELRKEPMINWMYERYFAPLI